MHKYTKYYGDDKENKKQRKSEKDYIAVMTTEANFDLFLLQICRNILTVDL